MTRAAYFIFFVSGFAGLIYEGTWARYLKMFLGHSSYGQILTISIYMGGLGIGSFLAAKLSPKIKSLFLAYVVIEVLIGLSGFAYHSVFYFITEWFYETSLTANLEPLTINIIKISLGVVITIPSAILLGMTFPFMANALVRNENDSGKSSISMLYFTNSLGAAIGILFTSYIFISNFGTDGTLYLAATLNLVIASSVIILGSYYNISKTENIPTIEDTKPNIDLILGKTDLVNYHEINTQKKEHVFWTKLKSTKNFDIRLWLIIAFCTGLTSFIYEIDWMRMLSLMMGASTHSFDIMLSAFIIGLALGSLTIKKILEKYDNLPVLLGIAQLLMGIMAMSTIYLYQHFFTGMNLSNLMFAKHDGGYFLWTVFKFFLAVLWMAPTSFFAGMTLPLITYFLIKKTASEKFTGQVYGFNTLGSITGAIIGGMILLPLLQLKWTIAIAAIGDILTGYILLLIYNNKARKSFILPFAIFLFCQPLIWYNYHDSILTSGVFRSYKDDIKEKEKDSIIVRSGKTATISFHENSLQKYIKTNGKVDASISKHRNGPLADDQRTQAATAFIPMATRNQPYDAAVIGFGSGMTVNYLLSDPLLKSLDMVEIEEEMINLAKGFSPSNDRAFNDPRINMVVDDARTYFHTSQRSYDVIISVPSNPWVSGVSSLFSIEFYHHIKRFLNEGGVLVQWLQLYEFNSDLLLNILKALDMSFKDITVYQVPGEPDVIMIAGDQEITQQYIERFKTSDSIAYDFQQIKRPYDYFGEANYITKVSDLKILLKDVEANSDFKPIVDHGAELARFKGSEVDLFQIMDKTNLSWSEYFNNKSFDKRKKEVYSNLFKNEDQYYNEIALTKVLEDIADTSDTNKIVYPNNFWDSVFEDFSVVVKAYPLNESRDNLKFYKLMKQAIMNEKAPPGVTAMFLFWDALKTRDWYTANQMIKIIDNIYELETLKTSMIRAMAITIDKANDRDFKKRFYYNAVHFNDHIKPIEKQLIQKVLRVKLSKN